MQNCKVQNATCTVLSAQTIRGQKMFPTFHRWNYKLNFSQIKRLGCTLHFAFCSSSRKLNMQIPSWLQCTALLLHMFRVDKEPAFVVRFLSRKETVKRAQRALFSKLKLCWMTIISPNFLGSSCNDVRHTLGPSLTYD